MNIGCWALLNNGCLKSCPERRSAPVARELQRYDVDIVVLVETWIHGKKNFVEKSAGYYLFWNGREETYKKDSEVGFAIKPTLVS